MTQPTDDQRRMADRIGLNPGMPDTWPMAAIDRLIWVEENRPQVDFDLEFNRLIRHPLRYGE